MSRIINPESVGKDRTRLIRAVVLALRELMRQTEPDALTRDLAAFIALALAEIEATIDPTVEPWEKRGYWVKADRFRMDWLWAGRLAQAMRQAVLSEDWISVARTSADVAMRVASVKVPERHRLGTPWMGAWQRLKQQAG